METMQASRLATAPAYGVLPAENLERARKFYHDVLGFEVEDYPEMRQFIINAGQGTNVMIYERERTKAEHTALSFLVADIISVMEDLELRGVRFEDYDMPGLVTERGIATTDRGLAAWFTDPEGNIINVTQMR